MAALARLRSTAPLGRRCSHCYTCTSLKIKLEVSLGPCAANENIACCWRLNRLGAVIEIAANNRTLAGVTHAGPARPSDRDIERLGEFEQAGKPRVPRDGHAASHKSDLRPRTLCRPDESGLLARLADYILRGRSSGSKSLAMNTLRLHAPFLQSRCKCIQESRWAAVESDSVD
jgi:hypothetical protein